MWEDIGEETKRLKVPGGWLVRSNISYIGSVSVALTYVPDPDHSWQLNDKKKES